MFFKKNYQRIISEIIVSILYNILLRVYIKNIKKQHLEK